jgi:RNA polymerase primary sigma factor
LSLLDQTIDAHPLLTADQEVDLARRIEDGDLEARERLIASNLRLVHWVAKRFLWSGLDLEDLTQEGYFGLALAADRFDWRRGHRFSTYATWWIRQRIMRAVDMQARNIRLPSQVAEDERRVETTRSDLEGELGREPTDEEIAAVLGVPIEDLRRLAGAARTVASLDAPAGDGDALGSFLAVGGDDVAGDVATMLAHDRVRRAVARLPERLREVVILRFGLGGQEPLTFSALGERLGVSRERARQLEQRALAELARQRAIADLREVG